MSTPPLTRLRERPRLQPGSQVPNKPASGHWNPTAAQFFAQAEQARTVRGLKNLMILHGANPSLVNQSVKSAGIAKYVKVLSEHFKCRGR